MGKMTLDLDDEIESKLRAFVRHNYLRSHGQLTLVIEKAIQEFVERQSVFDFIDQIGEGRHALLLYQDQEMARTLELRFMLNGLKKGLHAVYFLPAKEKVTPELIREQLAVYASQLGVSYDREKAHVMPLTYPGLRSKRMAKDAVTSLLSGIGGFSPAYAVVHFYSPSDGEQERRAEVEIESELQASFRGFPGSVLCNFQVTGLNPATISHWASEEVVRHHDVIYCLKRKNLAYKLD